MVKSDKNAKKIRRREVFRADLRLAKLRLIRRAVIFPADFRRTNFRRRIRRSAAAEESTAVIYATTDDTVKFPTQHFQVSALSLHFLMATSYSKETPRRFILRLCSHKSWPIITLQMHILLSLYTLHFITALYTILILAQERRNAL